MNKKSVIVAVVAIALMLAGIAWAVYKLYSKPQGTDIPVKSDYSLLKAVPSLAPLPDIQQIGLPVPSAWISGTVSPHFGQFPCRISTQTPAECIFLGYPVVTPACFAQGQTCGGGPCTPERPQLPICGQGPGHFLDLRQPSAWPCPDPLPDIQQIGHWGRSGVRGPPRKV